MRQILARQLRSGVALMMVLALGAPIVAPAALAQETAPAADTVAEPAAPAAQEMFNAAAVDTFSGAFLAARTADVDKDYKNAIALYRKALDLEPGNADIRQRLMIALFMSGDFDAGVAMADSLKNDPSVERITTITRGLAAIRAKDFAGAEAILKYDGPNDLERMMNSLLVAWARLGAGKKDEALAMITGLKGPAWFSIFRNYHAGAMAAMTGDMEKARKYLNDAVTDREGGATAPDTYVRAVMALARLDAASGNTQKALDAIALGDSFISNYAPLNALRDSIKAGEKPKQQILTPAQGAAAVLFSVGSALNRQGADDAVALYLQASHALDPDSADTLVLLGGIAENANQAERAIEFYRQVPANSPMQRISELQLGLALAQTGKTDEARAHLARLIASDPKDIRSYLAYGSVLSDAKDYSAMAANYDRAVEAIGPVAAPNHWSVFFQRGIAYERLKKWDKAEPNFKKALELNPDQPQVLNYLGYSWVDMNLNLEAGLDMIRRAVELRPDDGYIVDSLGWAYFRLNRFEDAVVELERAVELKAGDATINDHLGDAYWRVGRTLEARYQWQRALTMKPELPEIPKIEAKIKDGLPPLSKEATEAADAAAKASKAAAEANAAADTAPMETAPAETAPVETPALETPAATPDSPVTVTDYTVEAGDTIWKIAKKLLGDGNRGREIIAINPALKKNPGRLSPGQVIQIPAGKAPAAE